MQYGLWPTAGWTTPSILTIMEIDYLGARDDAAPDY